MFYKVTWTQFILFLIIGLSIYYLVILVNWIRSRALRTETGSPGRQPVKKRLWQVTQQDTQTLPVPQEDNEPPEADELHPWDPGGEETEEEKMFDALELLAADIEGVFAEPGLVSNRELLMDRLRQQIAMYPILTGAAFKNAIANLVTRKGEENNMAITRSEALSLWD